MVGHTGGKRSPTQPRQTSAPSPTPLEPPALTPQQQAALEEAVFAAVDRLPGSPEERYLADQGISLDVAQDHGTGWSETGRLAGRVPIPLTDDRSTITSMMGGVPAGSDAEV
ncbi:MAG: hypothetical protein ACR2OU_00165 [Thermomicrobiales bacterium]